MPTSLDKVQPNPTFMLHGVEGAQTQPVAGKEPSQPVAGKVATPTPIASPGSAAASAARAKQPVLSREEQAAYRKKMDETLATIGKQKPSDPALIRAMQAPLRFPGVESSD